MIDFSTYSLSVTAREREGQRGELTLIAPHRTQLPLAFAFSFHCWPSALPWIWKMSSNSSAGVGWYVQQCGLCCCTLPIPPAGRRHRRRAIARKKGRVGTVVEFETQSYRIKKDCLFDPGFRPWIWKMSSNSSAGSVGVLCSTLHCTAVLHQVPPVGWQC